MKVKKKERNETRSTHDFKSGEMKINFLFVQEKPEQNN